MIIPRVPGLIFSMRSGDTGRGRAGPRAASSPTATCGTFGSVLEAGPAGLPWELEA